MADTPSNLPAFVAWPSFPFEGQLRTKRLDAPVSEEPPREGEDPNSCAACTTPDESYVWVSDRWRVRAMDRPSGLPMVLILESRSHLDLGDLTNLLAAELGVMTVRLERAIRSLDGVERVHVNRWGDGAAHLHLWFLARPTGQLQLRGSFLSLWDDILEPISEAIWRENLALVAAWLADFGGRAIAEPPRIQWHAPSSFSDPVLLDSSVVEAENDGLDTETDSGGDSQQIQAGDDRDSTQGSPAASAPDVTHTTATHTTTAEGTTADGTTAAKATESTEAMAPTAAPADARDTIPTTAANKAAAMTASTAMTTTAAMTAPAAGPQSSDDVAVANGVMSGAEQVGGTLSPRPMANATSNSSATTRTAPNSTTAAAVAPFPTAATSPTTGAGNGSALGNPDGYEGKGTNDLVRSTPVNPDADGLGGVGWLLSDDDVDASDILSR